MIRRCIAALAATMSLGQPAAAQEVYARTNRPTPACTSPRATAALNNPVEPRRSDPRWIAFVVADGGCANLNVDVRVSLVGPFGDLSQVEYPAHSGAMRYIVASALTPDAPAPAATAEAVSVPTWQAAGRGSGPGAACELSGKAGDGTLTLNAQADHAGVVRMLLAKPAWRLPEGTPVRAVVTFSDRAKFALSGVGRGDHAVFELRDDLRQWVHEFTAAKTGAIAFTGGSEPPWQLDLAGTSAAVTAMAECIVASNISNVPPPFTPAPRPLAAVGGYSGAVPDLRPVTPASEPPAAPASPKASASPSETVLARWSGSGMMTTRPFRAPGPWELRWHSASGFFSARLHTVGTEDANLLANQGRGGDSSAYRPNGGTFYLEFSATADWSAEVVALPGLDAQGPAALQPQDPASTPGPRTPDVVPARLDPPPRLDRQDTFVEAVRRFKAAYGSAPNDMLKGATRPARGRELCAVLPGGRVSGWTGEIVRLSSNNEGKGVVSIRLAEGVLMKTWNNALSDLGDRTLIETSSPLFARVAVLAVGQKVRFSGDLVRDDLDCFKEGSLSVGGAMTEPEFIIRFTDIQVAG